MAKHDKEHERALRVVKIIVPLLHGVSSFLYTPFESYSLFLGESTVATRQLGPADRDISLSKKGDDLVKNDRHEAEDMTPLLQLINAKGDKGELRELVCSDELFWKSLRTQAEDSAKGGE